MDIEKHLPSLNKIIGILITVLFVIVLAILLYMYGGGLKLLVTNTSRTVDAFRDYDVTKRYGNGAYNVEFTDLITSAGGMEKRYYRYDLTMEAGDKKSADNIVDSRKQVIAIVNNVMSTFTPEEMNTEAERNRVKRIIQSEVKEYYPDVTIKGIYFTNFLHD